MRSIDDLGVTAPGTTASYSVVPGTIRKSVFANFRFGAAGSEPMYFSTSGRASAAGISPAKKKTKSAALPKSLS